MHLSIDTREVDNGKELGWPWVLDAEIHIAPFGNPPGGRVEKIHEVCDDYSEMRKRMIVLLEGIVGDLKEGVPDKYIHGGIVFFERDKIRTK